jgi:hypothetical protein
MESTWIILAISLIVISCWLISNCLKSTRIHAYITDRGGKVVSCKWQAKNRTEAGPLSRAHYRVRYVDAGGKLHEAACRTRTFSDVYFMHDEIVGTHGLPAQFVTCTNPDSPEGHPDSASHPTSKVQIAELEREVRRLRKRLKEEDQSPPSAG